MGYIVIENREVRHENASCLQSILMKYNDMYRYSVIIGGNLVYVVVKDKQPKDWERGWAE